MYFFKSLFNCARTKFKKKIIKRNNLNEDIVVIFKLERISLYNLSHTLKKDWKLIDVQLAKFIAQETDLINKNILYTRVYIYSMKLSIKIIRNLFGSFRAI